MTKFYFGEVSVPAQERQEKSEPLIYQSRCLNLIPSNPAPKDKIITGATPQYLLKLLN